VTHKAGPVRILCIRRSSAVLSLVSSMNGSIYPYAKMEHISLFRHFWHWTLAGVDRDGPALPLENIMKRTPNGLSDSKCP
jgi:hypothetical protein